MPKTPSVTQITAGKSVNITLTAPVCDYTAKRIAAVALQLRALNDAGKSQPDAAAALGLSVSTLRNYAALLGVSWSSLRPYAVNKKAMEARRNNA